MNPNMLLQLITSGGIQGRNPSVHMLELKVGCGTIICTDADRVTTAQKGHHTLTLTCISLPHHNTPTPERPPG